MTKLLSNFKKRSVLLILYKRVINIIILFILYKLYLSINLCIDK